MCSMAREPDNIYEYMLICGYAISKCCGTLNSYCIHFYGG